MGDSIRRLISFACEGETLVGSLDEAAASTGLLIVSGGNEVRAGAHRGMAMLATRIAAQGIPVFRYDRRGVGDSSGPNLGYADAAPDLAAAIAAFRHEQPWLTRIVGLGNCDAATTLALFGADAGLDALVLTNPWIAEVVAPLPPAAAIRARYAERLRDPRQWLRLVSGGVDLGKLIGGLTRVVRPSEPSNALSDQVAAQLAGFHGEITVILAERDNTAMAFADAWRTPAFAAVRARAAVVTVTSASHSFAGEADAAALETAVVAALGHVPQSAPLG